MSEELKPCPFCGGKAQHQWHSGPCWIECETCNAVGPADAETTTEQNEVAWNTRTPPPPQHREPIEADREAGIEFEVIQADREAAADIWRDYCAKVGEVIVERQMRAGGLDEGLPAILAAHRRARSAYLSQPIAAPQAEIAGGEAYLICKGGAYYRPNAQGYTRDKSEAGRYTLAEAISHSHPNGPDGPRDGITYELAPPQPEGGTVGDSDLRETFYYLCKWVERGLFDKHHTPKEALQVIAYHPGLPWMEGRWDVDHKPYAAEFYKAFPKAALQPEKTNGS